MAITPAQIAAAAAAEIPKIFQDALDGLSSGEGQFIKAGTPASIVGAISQAAARGSCRVYGTRTKTLSAAVAERYERACRPFLDTLTPAAGPVIETPFTGGQCAGLGYSYTRTILDRNGVVTNTTNVACSAGQFGPISIRSEPQGAEGVRWFIKFRQASGSIAESLIVSSNAPVKVVLSNMRRCDSRADNCGDPPPNVIAPKPVADPTPPPFRFTGFPGVDVGINVDISPDGKINFDIGTGPISIDPFADAPTGGGGGGGGTTPPPGDVGNPGTPSDTGAGGESEGQAPPGQVLVGLRVQVLSFPASRTKDQGGVLRGAYYAYMGVPGLLDLDPAGATVREDQFIFAEKENLTAWRVRANSGYNTRITPYYRTIS